MLEYYSGSECVRIEEDNNKWWTTYGVGYSPAECGPFASKEEAIRALTVHRPSAKLYKEF